MNAFEHFGTEHITALITIAAMITTGLLLTARVSDKKAAITARVLSIIVLAGEALQDILLIRDGGNMIGFLPLHLCNLGIFVNLAASFSRGKIQSYFAEISLVLIMPGAVGALFFPDWNYRPFWSYLPLLCFLTHSLLVFIPLMFLARKKIRVSFKHFWYPYLFLLLIVPPIYFLDRRTGTNYMYLIYPPKNSPLDWVISLTGGKYYLPGLAVVLTVILVFEYAIYTLARKRSRK